MLTLTARCLLISCWLPLSFASPSRADEALKCDPHQHMVVEKDEDQGAVMKRCVCDPGWDADGPGMPCRQAKQERAKKAKARIASAKR